MARDPSDYERKAREMDEIARACGHETNKARYMRTAKELRRKAHALAEGATFQLGQPVLHGPWSRTWWVVLVRAVAAVVFGVVTLGWPRHSALALLALFGAYALFDGLTMLLLSTTARRRRRWLTLGGAVSVIAGLLAFTRPRLLTLMLIGVLGAWLVFRGLTELLGEISPAGDADRGTARRRHWSAVVNAAMSAVFGAALIAQPKIGALGLMWAIGAWAVLHGLLMVPFAFNLRGKEDPGALT
jgi:uncharacterized membrane protein HdeD (DUF308 family)